VTATLIFGENQLRIDSIRHYAEEAAARFSMAGDGVLYACCNRHGLFRLKL